MAKTTDASEARNEDLSVKKNSIVRGTCADPAEPIRRTLLTLGEFAKSMADASAEAQQALNEELQLERVRSAGLTNSLIDGIAEGHVRFFERLARSSRAALERLRADSEKETESVAATIDYERLAKLVAAELKKADSGR